MFKEWDVFWGKWGMVLKWMRRERNREKDGKVGCGGCVRGR